ncbi:terminase [Alicyclobacillus acidoterrestris]|nr:terminase [Alicyclobacillus acidoterrestris]
MGKLTPKQKRFVDEYLIDLNATQAAIRAGYSEQTAYRIGADNLRKPQIQNAIQEGMAEREQRTEVTQDMVLQQLAKIAFHDITKFVTWDEQGVDIKPSDEVDGTVIAEVGEDVTDFGEYKRIKKKVKMPDRLRALEMLGRHLGMFNDKLQLSGQVTQTNEQKTHVIHELIADPTIAERIRDNFRRGVVQGSSET